VFHHTGDMLSSLDNLVSSVAKYGKLFIALYNDQGRSSILWAHIKKAYCFLPKYLRFLVVIPCYIRLWGPRTFIDFFMLQPFYTWRNYNKTRGMSPHRDIIDWIGGFPFEVSRPEQIFDFFKKLNFRLTKIKTCAGGFGCNEFVFHRDL
jgi:2-polyprenyl-6-hydroxyphenyl methylase/3-demethylubiquinone-9 3-methyltransferase